MGITAEEALGASMAYTNKKVSESAALHREIVTSLPATGDENIIYMVLDQTASSPDIYDEWLWTNGAYEHIGSTRVDLTDYYNKTQVDAALSGKQDTLTFDNVPTQNSNNMVKSGGIFSTMAVPKYDATNRREYFEGGAAFDGNIDSSPTAGSNNAVSSGGTKTYVDNAINTANADKVEASSNDGTCNGAMVKVSDTRMIIMIQNGGSSTGNKNMRIDLQTDKLRWQIYQNGTWNTIKQCTWD